MKRGFTLIELLISVGIMAVLAGATVMVLDPIKLLEQARDGNRLNDLQVLNKAIDLSVYLHDAPDNTEDERVYLSLPDTNGDGLCAEYTGLSPLPGSWEYRCMASSTNLRRTDGTGWLPIDFDSSIGMPSPLAVLPVDPTNGGRNFYAYSNGATQGDYSLFTALESERYQTLGARDGGNSIGYYETTPIMWKRPWQNIAYGEKTTFTTSEILETKVLTLGMSKFISLYRDTETSGYGSMVVGTVGPSSAITYSMPTIFSPETLSSLAIAPIDASRFVLSYAKQGATPAGYARTGTLGTGDVLTFGPEASFSPTAVSEVSTVMLDGTHLAVAYRDQANGGQGTVMIGEIGAGDVLTFGVPYIFNTAITTNISITKIDPAHFFIAYKDEGAGGYGTAVLGTVTGGNVVAYGIPVVFTSTGVGRMASVSLNASHHAVTYTTSPSWQGVARIAVISGTDISFGPEYPFNTNATNHIAMSMLNASYFVVAYHDGGDSGYGKAVIGAVNDNTEIAFEAPHTFNDTGDVEACAVSAGDLYRFVVSYRDNTAASGYGTAIVGNSATE